MLGADMENFMSMLSAAHVNILGFSKMLDSGHTFFCQMLAGCHKFGIFLPVCESIQGIFEKNGYKG